MKWELKAIFLSTDLTVAGRDRNKYKNGNTGNFKRKTLAQLGAGVADLVIADVVLLATQRFSDVAGLIFHGHRSNQTRPHLIPDQV